MKRCPTCNTENADAMQYCLQCGASLANAPFVVNFQGGGQQQQPPPQPPPSPNQPNSPFGQQQQQPFQNQFQNQFSNVPPSRPKSNSKIFLAIGGVVALILLLFAAGAAIVAYNYLKDEPVIATNTSTPSPTPTGDKSPSPSSSPTSTPRTSPTAPPFGSNTSTTNSSTTNSTTNPNGVRVSFEKQWVDYGVTEKGRTGMRIHTTFTVYKIKGVDSYLAIYFAKKDGSKLFSNNSEYRSKDGQVAVYRSLKPNYDETLFKDLTVFIPYDEFNLTRGKYDLRMDSDVIYENGDMVGHLNDYDFEYEKY